MYKIKKQINNQITQFILCVAASMLLSISHSYAQQKTPEKNQDTSKQANSKKAVKSKARKVYRNKKGRIVRTDHTREPISYRADDVIRVTEAVGTIKALGPLAVRWRLVKAGSVIPNGSLVIMDADSSMKYDFYIRRASGWFGKQAYVSITKPTNFRIHTSELRKIKLGELYLPQIPTKEPEPPEMTPEMLGIKAVLDHIWKRVASFVQNDSGGRGFADQLAKKTDIDSSLGLRARKIEMLAPVHAAGVYAFNVPQEMKAIWKAPKDANIEQYKLFVWNSKDLKPTNDYIVVKGNRHTVYLNEDGSYYFQVQSISGDYSSSPHLVHFFTNKNPSGRVKKNIEEKAEELHLTAKFPRFADTFVSRAEKAKVQFSWDESDALREGNQNLIIINRKTGKTSPFPVKGHKSITLSLPEGDYEWQIVAQITQQKKNKKGELVEVIQEFKGEKRPFAVYQAKDTANLLSDLFYLYRFQDTTVYMSEGL